MRKLFSGLNQIAAGLGIALSVAATPAVATDLTFFYPVAVGGPVTKIVDDMAAAFEKEHPGIRVKPVYSGSYQDTLTKVLTASKGGELGHKGLHLHEELFVQPFFPRQGALLRR